VEGIATEAVAKGHPQGLGAGSLSIVFLAETIGIYPPENGGGGKINGMYNI